MAVVIMPSVMLHSKLVMDLLMRAFRWHASKYFILVSSIGLVDLGVDGSAVGQET